MTFAGPTPDSINSYWAGYNLTTIPTLRSLTIIIDGLGPHPLSRHEYIWNFHIVICSLLLHVPASIERITLDLLALNWTYPVADIVTQSSGLETIDWKQIDTTMCAMPNLSHVVCKISPENNSVQGSEWMNLIMEGLSGVRAKGLLQIDLPV